MNFSPQRMKSVRRRKSIPGMLPWKAAGPAWPPSCGAAPLRVYITLKQLLLLLKPMGTRYVATNCSLFVLYISRLHSFMQRLPCMLPSAPGVQGFPGSAERQAACQGVSTGPACNVIIKFGHPSSRLTCSVCDHHHLLAGSRPGKDFLPGLDQPQV